MSLYHQYIQIQAYKHDGSFHRLWSHGFVVCDNDDFIAVASNRVRVIEADDHSWHTKEKAVFIFSKKEWFNVIATFREDGIHYYVNVASPAVIDKEFIKFIDYDLDIKGFPNGFTKVLDINEFKSHCDKYGYSDDLKKVLENALKENEEKIKNKIYPFDDEAMKKYITDFDNYVARQKEIDDAKRAKNEKGNN